MKPQHVTFLIASLFVCINVSSQESQTINKCVIDGKIVYQSESCSNLPLPASKNNSNKGVAMQQERQMGADARRAEQTRQRDEIQKGFRDARSAPALVLGSLLSIPSDPKAQFFVLQKGGSGAQRTIVTKRVGPSGVSYSERLFNCTDSTWKYLGTGDSLAEMTASKANPNMGPILDGSIAYYVGVEVCK